MIIGISGLTFDPKGNKGSAGAGKDTVADRLVAKHGFTRLGFADVMKRFLQEIFQFSDEQLFGESKHRNAPDARYARMVPVAHPKGVLERNMDRVLGPSNPGYVVHREEFLTPRHALQQLGTEFGRACYQDVWVAYAMRVAKELIHGVPKMMPYAYPLGYEGNREEYEGIAHPKYSLKLGLHSYELRPAASIPNGVVFSDMRFKNEFEYVKNNGGKVVRVRRPVDEITIPSSHQSENDLNDVPDDAFDYVIHGLPKDVHDLGLKTDEMMDWLKGRIRPFDPDQVDTPPFLRK